MLNWDLMQGDGINSEQAALNLISQIKFSGKGLICTRPKSTRDS